MKKLGKVLLTGVSILGLCTMASAVEIKVGGKVDGLLEFAGGRTNNLTTVTKENYYYTMQNPRLFNALLNVDAKISDTVSARISNNFAGVQFSGQERNTTAEKFVAVKLGPGAFKAGSMVLPGLKERNTIFNNTIFDLRVAMNQLSYVGDAGPIAYNVAVYGGTMQGKRT